MAKERLEVKEAAQPAGLWFDIEKSQKRYEDLLDKHQRVGRSD